MEIIVETATGDKLALQVEATDTIENVKTKILESGGSSSVSSFFLQGPELKEDRTLGDYQIENGDTLQMRSNILQIFVKTPICQKLALEVNRFDTIAKVKSLIEEKTEILPHKMLLHLAGSLLEDGRTVHDSQLKNGDTVDLTINVIDICIKTPTGKRFNLEVNRNATIETVKGQISAREDIPREYQTLFYGRKFLEDGLTVQDYEIATDDTLDLVQLVLRIFVRMPTMEAIALAVHRNDTISSVKMMIQKRTGLLPHNYSLYFDGTPLEKEVLTVDEYRFKQGTRLTLRSNDIKLFISTWNGARFSIDVNLNDTISSVKVKIGNQMDMLSKNVFVYLSRSGEIDLELEDDGRTVKGYNLVNDDCLTLLKSDMSIPVTLTISGTSRTIALEVKRYDTIATVKRRIAKSEGAFSMKTHFLFYGDSQLNEERTLHYYLKKSLSKLTLELKVLDMLVFIKTLTGKTLSINFKWEDTVERVKEYIQDKEGRIYPDRHALSLAGDQLEDSRTMVSYNISNESTLEIVGLPSPRIHVKEE